jgi:hypothetical protein
MRAEDAFWAARLVAAFSEQAIRAVVAKARYSDPAATEFVAATLITRRDKVLKAWLTGINPVVDPVLAPDGTLTFANAAVQAGVTSAPASYALTWSRFDNAAGQLMGDSVGMEVAEPKAQAPGPLLEGGEFVAVAIRTRHSAFPRWEMPVTAVFRRSPEGWQTVGLERQIEGANPPTR